MSVEDGPDTIGTPAPMTTHNDWYEARFREYVIKFLECGTDGGWSLTEALDAAQNELDNLSEDERSDDPEADARECMSYWDTDE